MTRVHVLVEGQTEEAFVKQVVAPYLNRRQIFLTPIILSTKRTKDGRKFRGGFQRTDRLLRDLRNLLGDTAVAAVTTMVDFYGVPDDFPGFADLPPGDPYERVAFLEDSLRREVGDPRFLPYLSLHEFEALVLAGPEELTETFQLVAIRKKRLSQQLGLEREPEEINDGEDTHPSARLENHLPEYRKTVHGPLITGRIGLPQLRQRCRHFDDWIRQLEHLAS